jgi:hypothetical protein
LKQVSKTAIFMRLHLGSGEFHAGSKNNSGEPDDKDPGEEYCIDLA